MFIVALFSHCNQLLSSSYKHSIYIVKTASDLYPYIYVFFSVTWPVHLFILFFFIISACPGYSPWLIVAQHEFQYALMYL